MAPSGKIAVWLKTVGVLAAYAIFVWLLKDLVAWRWAGLADAPLEIALLTTVVCAIALMLVDLTAVRVIERHRERRAMRVDPLIRGKLAAHLTGVDQLDALKTLARSYPHNVELSLAAFLASVTGTQRDLLSVLAQELGLVARWTRRYGSRMAARRERAISRLALLSPGLANPALYAALSDRQEEIRVAASRALLDSARREEVEKVFAFATAQPLLVRALLAENLRPHVLTLCERAIPEVLASTDTQRVKATLEMLEAWQRLLLLPGFTAMLRHPDPEIRARGFRLLPYVANVANAEQEILTALRERDPEVKASAAYAAARLGVEAALPRLQECLGDPDCAAALAAAYALAELGPRGLKALENGIVKGGPQAAGAALESLERASICR